MADDKTKAALCGSFARYFDSTDLSDFTIKCHGSTWKVHRLVLSLHSDVMAKWCSGDFKEVKVGSVNLSVHEIQHVDALVKYLYTFDYSEATEGHTDKLSFHVTMCVIADKYNISGLKDLAISKFNKIVKATGSADDLVQACLIAWEAAPATSAIRDSIVSLINEGRAIFLPNPATEDSKQLEEAMRTYPDLAIEVARFTPPILPKPKACVYREFKCDSARCGATFKAHIPRVNKTDYDCPKCGNYQPGMYWNNFCIIH